MTEHTCEVLMPNGEPCGKPARFKLGGNWWCARCYDNFIWALGEMGFSKKQIKKFLEEV